MSVRANDVCNGVHQARSLASCIKRNTKTIWMMLSSRPSFMLCSSYEAEKPRISTS